MMRSLTTVDAGLRRRPRSAVACVLLGALFPLLVGGPARAQTSSLDVQTFQPSTDTLGGFGVTSARPLDHLDWTLGLLANYASAPLRLRTVEGGDVVREIVRDRVTADVIASLGLADLLQLSLDVPVVAFNGGDGTIGASRMDVGGVGDVRFRTEIGHVWGVFGASLGAEVLFPTGNDDAFLGTGGVRGGPIAALELDFRVVQVIANLGARFQDQRELANLEVDHELRLGFALLGRFRSIGFDLVGEGSVYTRLQAPFERQNETGLELRAGFRYRLPGDIVLLAGAGPGVLGGYGTPEWRAFLGLLYDPDVHDSDGDGLLDDVDACPLAAEDFDGRADEDGCPDPDDDGDGVPDVEDDCPLVAEDCDGFEDADGCPDPDNDQDGVPDVVDRCPLGPEDRDGFEDADGCPDPDNDGDGILDGVDKCPDARETFNDVDDADGCPDERKSVEVTCERIAIYDTILFESGKARIDPVSFPLLDDVAATILMNPFIRRVSVEGHTDSEGSTRFNLRLSDKRAQAVRQYLVARGVPAAMLTARGFGESLPIDTNRTEEGRATNRRVEFVITDQDARPECP